MSGTDSPPAPVLTQWVGRLSGVGVPLRAPQQFVAAGIDWQGPAGARIELRARRADGGWTPWVRASVLGHDGDRGESIAHALVGDLIWTGSAEALQLRSATLVEGLNLHLVLAAGVGVSGPNEELAATAQGLPLAEPRLPAGPGQPPIIARHAWAGSLPPRAAPSYGDVRMAFVHHSVNANGYSAAQVPAMLRSIYAFHTYVRGWNDFGYNFAVDAYGRIWEGRAGGIDRPVIGAQAGGYNTESFGAVLLGDFAATLPTGAARTALAHLIAWKLALHGVPVSGRVTVEVDPSSASYTRFRPGQRVSLPRIAGHRDGCTTDCPGSDMYVHGLPPLRRSVRELVGRQFALTLAVGPTPGAAYSLAPYPIAPGTKIKRASYLDLPRATITAGRELPVHGFLRRSPGGALKSARITLQDLTSTRADPAPDVAHVVTGPDGLWVNLLKPHSNMLLRALHADAPAVASSLFAVAVRPELTLGIVTLDAEAKASGTVFPAKRRLLLEVRSGGDRPRVVQRKTIETDDGFFEATIKLDPGRYLVTALTQADALNVAGESPEVALDIR